MPKMKFWPKAANNMKLLIFFLLVSCSFFKPEKKVFLVKQWHLTAATNTTQVEKAKNSPQFENQKEIYLWVEDKLKEDKQYTIIAEGCEGEISEGFSEKFNGWTLQQLQAEVGKEYFADILAPVPMKLKAKYPDLKVVCGDDLMLIKQNLKAASDMRGYFGFLQRMMEAKEQGDQKKFEFYASNLKDLFPRHSKIEDPIEFTAQKVKKTISEFEDLIYKRNQKFLSTIQKYDNPIVIIGGLHVEELSSHLKSKNISFEVVVPKGYRDDENQLLAKFKKFFDQKLSSKIKFFMFPESFDMKSFPFGHLIAPKEIATEKELSHLLMLTKKFEVREEVLFSDFDKDGIRDFSVATFGDNLVISVEDLDWDNDGIENLLDETVSETQVAKLSKTIPMTNNYLSQTQMGTIVNTLKKDIHFVQEAAMAHEFLVVEILSQLRNKINLPTKNIKFLRSANLNISVGQNNFFNYVKASKTLNYDPLKLKRYIDRQYKTNFKGAQFKQFINAYVIPLIIHSLTHEVAHSLDWDYFDLAKQSGWKYEKKTVKSLYLKNNREVLNKREEVFEDITFRGKTYTQWLKSYRTKKAKDYLTQNRLISMYATSNPNEWFAELFAMCQFRKIYPRSKHVEEARRYEQLLGINPSATSKKECGLF